MQAHMLRVHPTTTSTNQRSSTMTTDTFNATEERMGLVRDVFAQAANAITAASELSKEVANLRNEVEALKRDMEYTRARNKELDEILSDVRRQRDEAQAKLRETEGELANHKSMVSVRDEDIRRLNGSIDHQRETITRLTKERDESIEHGLNLEQKLKEATAKIDQLSSHIGSMLSLIGREVKEVEAPKPDSNSGQGQPPDTSGQEASQSSEGQDGGQPSSASPSEPQPYWGSRQH